MMTTKLKTSNIILVLLISALVLSACSSTGSVSGFFQSKPTLTPTESPTSTPEPPTMTPLPTETPLPTATPTLEPVTVAAGQNLTVPILLYHHIGNDHPGNRYYVPTEAFDAQMKWLSDHHYQTITVEQLAKLILYGGEMPQRPVVITFDDGDADMVMNGLPILQKYNFVATAFLIVTWIDAPEYITSDQVHSLINAGWEIGSHSMSHIDLTQNKGSIEYEIGQSMATLNQKFGLDVRSFAYPFGMIDSDVANAVSRNGYLDGVGLGEVSTHNLGDLYYLIRIEIREEYSMDKFASLMPWQD
jgi:peptidoglycan/xylan/chitin deacetylase (PgdA/CDA1 family)